MRHWLASAVTGGQWPQVRRARVPRWEVDDRCQLCLQATGTLEHRWQCNSTVPADGWVQHAQEQEALLSTWSEARRRLLRTRGIAVVAILVAPALNAPQLRWRTSPPDPTNEALEWFSDGFVVFPKWDEAAAAAAASSLSTTSAGWSRLRKRRCLAQCAPLLPPRRERSVWRSASA